MKPQEQPAVVKALIEQGFEETWSGSGEYQRRVEGDFGFRVRVKATTPDYDDDPLKPLAEPEITVALPHQCDAWEIVEEVSDREQADAKMEKFIEEARAAFNILLTLRLDNEEMG